LLIINFGENKIIEKLHPSTFNDLINSEEIDFHSNKIKELDPCLVASLNRLKKIHFGFNRLKPIHSSTFNGLARRNSFILK
jgi:hypothetical protein